MDKGKAMTAAERTVFVQIVGQVLIADGILDDAERTHLDTVMDDVGLEGDARSQALKGIDQDSPIEERMGTLSAEVRTQLVAAAEAAAAIDEEVAPVVEALLKRIRAAA